MALQRFLSVPPAGAAVVACGDYGCARGFRPARAGSGVCITSDLGRVRALQFRTDQPRDLGQSAERGRSELRTWISVLHGGLGTSGWRQAARWSRKLPPRSGSGGDARQGHLSQPPDRTHPVRADHARGPTRTCAHRSGLDHEILHPRSVTTELYDQIPCRSGFHGLCDLLEESRS